MQDELQGPLQRYHADLQLKDMIADPAQEQAVRVMQALYDQLLEAENPPGNRLHTFIVRWLGADKPPLRGIYLWGGVGRGKTWIVDSFFESLPFQDKLRIHFHRFMQRVHGELNMLKNTQDPLQLVADDFARQARVVCFDEFHVTDITDAMLLSGLLKALFDRGVVLVATSNEHPDMLYRDGLQRQRFLPAIALLKQHTRVIHLDTEMDYRLRYLDMAETFHFPLDDQARQMLVTNFEHIAPNAGRVDRTIEIEGRKIHTVRCADGVVWFDFHAICDGPRGAADYIEISRQFQSVFISDIPQLGEDQNDQARRLMTLVDEFYDRHVKLILTAEVDIQDLYTGKRLADMFRRTVSRLVEMQSHEYLARQHLSE